MDLKIPLPAFARPLAPYHWWFWRLGRIIAWLSGGRHATGTQVIPRTGPVVVIAPHLSFLDALFLAAALPRPSRFLTAAFYIEQSAALSWLFYLAGVIPVRRHRADPTAVRRAFRLLARGEVIAFFPEGGRNWTGVPHLPTPPAVKLLLGLKVPIYVAAIHGSYDYWPRFAATPRPRKVSVRILGPLSIADGRPLPAPERKEKVRRWWSDVYAAGGRADVGPATEEIHSRFAMVAAGEGDRLRLELPGRLAALTRILCFCPECATAALAFDGRSLACPACGVTLHAARLGRVRLVSTRGDTLADLSVHELFTRMLSRLEARTRTELRLEERVEAGEIPRDSMDAGTIPFRPALAWLDRAGLRVVATGREIHRPLTTVAAASMVGSEILEIPHGTSGTVLYLRAPAGAFRLLLAARACLHLPLESMRL